MLGFTNLTKPFDLYDSVQLLRGDLVWSSDFEAIRKPLANLLESIGENLTAVEITKIDFALNLVLNALWEETNGLA